MTGAAATRELQVELPKKILVVDDDPHLLRLLSIRLQTAGFEPVTAESAEAALAKLPAVRPSLIITDLRMEGMNGMMLFDTVRSRYPLLPVIILTAHGSIPEAVEATKRGVFGFLTKPFDSQILLEQVRSALAVSGGMAGADEGEQNNEWRAHILTRSPLMEDVLSRARLVAASHFPPRLSSSACLSAGTNSSGFSARRMSCGAEKVIVSCVRSLRKSAIRS